jgi:N-acetylglucosamine kinase-like BadF-type ATPase
VKYFLGIDGGASKTHALLAASTGQVLGFGKGGPGNHQTSSLESALNQIDLAVRQAFEQAGISHEKVELGCFCLAGADLPEDYALLQRAVEAQHLAKKVHIKNDTLAALRAGLTRSWGIAVICGTGFNAAGRAPDAREIVLPGLGPISGDWGGGGDLSQEVIRAVMRAWDGRGKRTQLTQMVLNTLELPSEPVLLSKLYHEEIDPLHILDLVKLLFEASANGDEVAQDLVIRMGNEVGVSANALLKRLNLEQTDAEVVLSGSVFKGKGSLLIDTASQVIHQVAPRAQIVRPRFEPVVGALLLALESADLPVTPRLIGRLISNLPDSLSSRDYGLPIDIENPLSEDRGLFS